jgi:hypothetical protein
MDVLGEALLDRLPVAPVGGDKEVHQRVHDCRPVEKPAKVVSHRNLQNDGVVEFLSAARGTSWGG